MHRRTAQPSGAATPEEADTRRRACIHFLRLFFRWQFRWQHKTTLWPGEESALFRRMSRCVRSFSERRVCTRFHLQKRTWANEQEGKYFHGCRFIDINTKEQERMVREIFLLQRDEIRRRNGQ